MGFPPFLGGPFRYADLMGPAKMAAKMAAYAEQLGPHFHPPQILLDTVKAGRKFHSS